MSGNWIYRVYPSFCGGDVRKGFLSHIQKEFERKGITLFTDKWMSIGAEIFEATKEAIKGSRISIVLISKNYASSTWCLDELVMIMKCRRELGQIVMAIFYEVEPSDVKKQRGYFGSEFMKVCEGEKVEVVERWREALEEVARIDRYDLSNWFNEADMIEKVANDVSNMLNKAARSSDFDRLVGMENHIRQVSSLLSLDSNDVRMVGIWGPAGIGKTTIARALYSKLSNSFTRTAFMGSIRGSREKIFRYDDNFMFYLQEQLFSKIFNREDLIRHWDAANESLKEEKVLVVLDDMDDLKYLKAIACKNQWFGCGSRIIITTTDKKLLKAHGIDNIYHVGFPSSSEALEIFCLSAFDQKSPYVGFEELTMEIRGLSGNLPLGLNVYGSYLRGMSKEEWMHALPRLRTSLDTNIKEVLRCNYEALRDEYKDLFLHIACFSKGERTRNMVKYFSNLDVKLGLQVLAEKSLISLDKGARLMMHNLLEQLGIEIARKEYRDENVKGKFVVDARKICDVLADNTGSGSVRAIDRDLTAIKDELNIEERAFEEISESFMALSRLPFQASGSGLGIDHILSATKEELGIDEYEEIYEPITFSRTHHVFPSFYGVDVRKSLLSHMLKEFKSKGITAFDKYIEWDKPIGTSLTDALRRSRISIVLISKNYASSTWCLDELVVIMKCRKELSQTVMTIFYEVEPFDVKKQRGYFGAVFEKTCVGKSVEDIKKWKQTLEEVAEIAGYDSRNWKNEADMIEKVANDVSNMLNKAARSSDFDRLVGMENHIRQVSSLLSLDSNDVRMVGIWGPAGIGKTTIARALYSKLSNSFTHTAFMGNLRLSRAKIYNDDHALMLYLQEQLLSKTLNLGNLKIDHLGVAAERLKDKKVLVILDDVDDLKPLKAMACKNEWFGCGSRIIVTTTDKKLLKAHGIYNIYHVGFPSSSEALEIFCLSAFKQDSPYVGFEELTMEVTGLAGNLPLGLSVFGSYLRGLSKEEWMQELPRLRTSLRPYIKEVLRCNYETLCDKDKELFLHIACFFNGKKASHLSKYLSKLDVTHGLQVLAEKSLISIDKGERLVMHNLLERLGKEIVHKENRDEKYHKFLVDPREIFDELADNSVSFDSIDKTTYEIMSLPCLPSSCTHQVFASFCGVDVRDGFLSHVQKEFERKAIALFFDNDIEKGKSIGPELVEAIKGSRISIVLISKNYASSTWCLEELVEIMKCRRELDQIVMTIFYKVEPSDVKKQMGYFGSVFQKTCVGKKVEDVERWRAALEEVAKVAGYDISSGKNEADMIQKVANDVSNMLNKAAPSSDFNGLVGMENHITQVNSLLSLDSNDVRMVGIWGPSGIGKTTIARALYSKLSSNFTHTAFMESTRGSRENLYSDDYAFMLHLQEQLLSKTLNHKDLKIDHLGVAEERLKDKKVLVVLDDVDDLKQLKAMVCKTQWFGCGSRIIITTKDNQLLKAHEINHIYHVEFPSVPQAYQILCLSAFRQKSPYVGFEELIMEVIGLAGNLPLGLSVFGSYLRGRPKEEWMDTLPILRTSVDGKFEKVLRFSYEALSDNDKDLFLHIACLFEGESISYLEKCLAHNDVGVRQRLRVLAEKSLISITEEEHLVMHNLVEQLGKDIVRKEHINEPERRKFLVDAQEISDVLADNIGPGSVIGIDLNITAIKDELSIDERAFERMPRLQFLRFGSPYIFGINNKLVLPRGLNNLPRKLRVLRWDEFPLRCLPPKFRAEFLVILEMRNSCIEKLWEEAPPLRHLKLVDMSYSLNLKEVPNLSNATNLETLTLNACESLVEIPTWIQNLSRLTHLKMVGCKKLKVLPTNINLESLYHLDLSHCTQLKTFPEISTRVRYLDLENTGIEEVSSIRLWPDLAKLSMRGCKSLRMFPNVLDSMEELNLSDTE